jgi:putative DNA primase/helicase
MLTAVARFAVGGPVPLFAYRATAPGSGKGLNVDVISLTTTGRRAACTAADRSTEEMRKMLLALAIEGAGIVVFDNIEGAFGSAALAMALTSEEIEDRVLGLSKRARASLRTTTWFATGNNTTFKGDLARRVVVIDMDAEVEHPEDRQDFEISNLRAWTRQHRAELVIAALTILRAYICAGKPLHGGPRMGSFEEWDDLIRGACIWADFGDPLESRSRLRKEGDADLDGLRAALAVWALRFGDTAVTTSAAIDRSREDTELRSALATLTGSTVERLDAVRLGYAMRKARGRVADGLKFECAEERVAGKRRWRVVKAGSGREFDAGPTFEQASSSWGEQSTYDAGAIE